MLVLSCEVIYLWERTSEKRSVKINNWGFFVHFVLRFEENSIETLQLCFNKDITTWCKVCTKRKAGSWFQKTHEEFEKLQTRSGKSKKLNFDDILSKKYIPLADDLSNITFSYLCEYSPNSLYHFSNHQSFFLTQLLCIFLAQTLHTFH